MKIPLVAQPRRQNASARGLALSFPPLQARLNRREKDRTRANATFALRPDLAKKCEWDTQPPAFTAKWRFPVQRHGRRSR
eukprot:1997523-Pleurochrysis_carterae.AAC.1